MKISAVIPVKANSSRLPKKNILPFRSSNLLQEKINQLKQIQELGFINEIIVSSDSAEMLEMARKSNVTIDERPLCYADESRPFSDFLLYICSQIQYDTLMWACCTSPFMDVETYINCIQKYKIEIENGYDSLITVYKFQHFLLDKKGPFNFKRGPLHVNSQELPSFDLFTNGLILSPKNKVIEWKYHFGENPYRFYVNAKQAIDIDTKTDYDISIALDDYYKKPK